MKSIRIAVHSFVDIITNSSSEIYVSATSRTIDTAKAVINSILALQGVGVTADDLFDVKLTYGIKNYEKTDGEFKYFDTEDERTTWAEANELDEYDEYTTEVSELVITPKQDTPELKAVVEALEAFLNSQDTIEGQQ